MLPLTVVEIDLRSLQRQSYIVKACDDSEHYCNCNKTIAEPIQAFWHWEHKETNSEALEGAFNLPSAIGRDDSTFDNCQSKESNSYLARQN